MTSCRIPWYLRYSGLGQTSGSVCNNNDNNNDNNNIDNNIIIITMIIITIIIYIYIHIHILNTSFVQFAFTRFGGFTSFICIWASLEWLSPLWLSYVLVQPCTTTISISWCCLLHRATFLYLYSFCWLNYLQSVLIMKHHVKSMWNQSRQKNKIAVYIYFS